MEIIRLRDGEYCLIIDDEVCDLYIAKLLSIEYDLYIQEVSRTGVADAGREAARRPPERRGARE